MRRRCEGGEGGKGKEKEDRGMIGKEKWEELGRRAKEIGKERGKEIFLLFFVLTVIKYIWTKILLV